MTIRNFINHSPGGRKECSLGLICILTIGFFAIPSFGAELLPFPSRDKGSQFQQAAPHYRQSPPPAELEQFRHDIKTISCPDINTLYNRLRSKYDKAEITADKEYYSRFLSELYREMTSPRCKK